MRKLLFKNATSWKNNKKDIFVQEIVKKDGMLAKTTRRCLYFIKGKRHIKDTNDLKYLAELKFDNEDAKRHFHVLKEHNSILGVDKLMCKVAGTFYAIVNDYLYCIVFIHTFKISFSQIKR